MGAVKITITAAEAAAAKAAAYLHELTAEANRGLGKIARGTLSIEEGLVIALPPIREINSCRLYEAECPTWQAYCAKHFKKHHRTIRKYMDREQVQEEMDAVCPIGHIKESWARELIQFPAADRHQAMADAGGVANATAAKVRDALDTRREENQALARRPKKAPKVRDLAAAFAQMERLVKRLNKIGLLWTDGAAEDGAAHFARGLACYRLSSDS